VFFSPFLLPLPHIFVATGYGLDGPGIESRLGGEIFRTRPDQPWVPSILLCDEYRVFPGGKAAGAWPWPPTSFSAEVKERVVLYICSHYWPSWSVLGWTLTSRNKGKGLPQQAEVAQGVRGRLRTRIFLTFGTTRVIGRQPYASAAFTPE